MAAVRSSIGQKYAKPALDSRSAEIGSKVCVLGAILSWRRRKSRSVHWKRHCAAAAQMAKLGACIAIAAIIAFPGLATAADRHSDARGGTVSMAIACAIVGGRVQIETATERTYSIIGKRHQKTVHVCSGSSGTRCRELRIHKFVFDCEGKPVEWIKAAEATARGQPWKATLKKGRMTLHRWPDGRGKSRRRAVTLPAGYAPPPASGLIFAAPSESGEVRGAKEADRAPDGSRLTSSPSVERSSRPGNPGRGVEAARPQPTAVVRIGGNDGPAEGSAEPTGALTSSPKPGWTATAVIGDQSRGDTWWRMLVPSGVPNVLLAGMGIAALLLSATVLAARQQAVQRTSSDEAPAIDAGQPVSPGNEAEAPPPSGPGRHEARDDAGDPVAELAGALRAAPPLSESADWASVDEARTTAEALLDLVRQIVADHVPEGAVRDVLVADLAVIAARLDSRELSDALAEGRIDVAQSIYSQTILDLERARTLSRIEHERALRVVDEQHRSPGTVEEACAFLGVNPRASEAVVKKVVDALRQNWHPDLAGDDGDRHAREDRIKQINAAWDLIRAR
jgi:hypothetical protein